MARGIAPPKVQEQRIRAGTSLAARAIAFRIAGCRSNPFVSVSLATGIASPAACAIEARAAGPLDPDTGHTLGRAAAEQLAANARPALSRTPCHARFPCPH